MGNIDLLEDACAKLPHTTRKMFGGHGLFAPNGGMFAGIVDDDQIVLKLADETARQELIALGTAPWVYRGKQGAMTMAQWILAPDDFYDEPTKLAEWAARAYRLVPAGKPKPAPRKATTKATTKATAKPTTKATTKATAKATAKATTKATAKATTKAKKASTKAATSTKAPSRPTRGRTGRGRS